MHTCFIQSNHSRSCRGHHCHHESITKFLAFANLGTCQHPGTTINKGFSPFVVVYIHHLVNVHYCNCNSSQSLSRSIMYCNYITKFCIHNFFWFRRQAPFRKFCEQHNYDMAMLITTAKFQATMWPDVCMFSQVSSSFETSQKNSCKQTFHDIH